MPILKNQAYINFCKDKIIFFAEYFKYEGHIRYGINLLSLIMCI